MLIPSKPKPLPPFDLKTCNLPTTSTPKPSCQISISKNGEELNLRPTSPHRYKPSTDSKHSNSTKLSKHSRSSTHTSGFSKFIPATEIVSFEIQTFEEFTDEVSEDEISNLQFEDEPKHWNVYPSLHSNRNSMIGSTLDAHSSAASSPLDQRFSNVCEVNSGEMGKEEKERGVRERFVASNEQVYCPRCRENVNFDVKIEKLEENFWQRICCGIIFDKGFVFVEKVILCKSCKKEIAKIKYKEG